MLTQHLWNNTFDVNSKKFTGQKSSASRTQTPDKDSSDYTNS